MEKRLENKCKEHTIYFKDEIRDWFKNNDCTIQGKCDLNEFITFIYNFKNISISKDDFMKRKRIKSIIPQFERCCANRANGEQCTRRRQEGIKFCGTHEKGTPHGIVNDETINNNIKKVEIFIQEIKGINYYIDNNFNVYKCEDVISNKVNPSIIANYKKDSNGNYSISDFS